MLVRKLPFCNTHIPSSFQDDDQAVSIAREIGKCAEDFEKISYEQYCNLWKYQLKY